jgi:purine nucleosidase
MMTERTFCGQIGSIGVLWWAFSITLGLSVAIAKPETRAPQAVIYDTDMWGDVDDALGLAMLNALQDRGEVQIAAVTISTQDRFIPAYISAVEKYYGHEGVPIGMVRSGVTPQAITSKYGWLSALGDGYPAYVAKKWSEACVSRCTPLAISAEDATSLLRELLVRAPNHSIVMISVGYSTNMANLLRSSGDQYSDLPGRSLIARKVKFLSVMGAAFGPGLYGGPGPDNGKQLISAGQPEFNVSLDVASAAILYKDWPTPIVVSGAEIGVSATVRGDAIALSGEGDAFNPIVEAYRYVDPVYRSNGTRPGHLHDHLSFDMTSVLYAARPDAGYFSLSHPGVLDVRSDGSTEFRPSKEGKTRYLKWSAAQRARAIEAITLLSTQPRSLD